MVQLKIEIQVMIWTNVDLVHWRYMRHSDSVPEWRQSYMILWETIVLKSNSTAVYGQSRLFYYARHINSNHLKDTFDLEMVTNAVIEEPVYSLWNS